MNMSIQQLLCAKPVKLMSFLILPLLSFSCSPYHIPSSVNTPILEERGDVNIGGNFGSFNNINLHSSVALGDHTAMIASGQVLKYNSDPDFDFGGSSGSDELVNRQYFGELGFGLYGKAKSLLVNGFAGLGRGKIDNDYYINDGNTLDSRVNGVYNKGFFQTTVMFHKERFNAGAVGKFNYLWTNDMDVEGEYWNNVDSHEMFFFHPGLFISFLSETVQINFQFLFTSDFEIDRNFRQHNDDIPYIFTAGINFHL